MVGGNWDTMGELQFRFMLETGKLKPADVLLDIGCGSFRGGRFFIEYLHAGNYLGIDKQKECQISISPNSQSGLIKSLRSHSSPI
jgi:hypothetical protein